MDLRRADEEANAAWADADVAGRVQTIAGRVFHQADGLWKDVAFREGGRVIEIEAYSPLYFELIEALPELELVLRELDSVLLAGDEIALQVGAEGRDHMSAEELAELVLGFRGGDGD